jgi:FlaA1/EpsC-like NDP-sugar epimerase
MLESVNRRLVGVAKMFFDLGVLSLTYVLAFLIRFEGIPPLENFDQMLVSLPVVVGLQYLCLVAYGVQRFSWRFVSLPEAQRIILALSLASTIMITCRLIFGYTPDLVPGSVWLRVSLGVLLIDLIASVLGLLGMRVCLRRWIEQAEWRTGGDIKRKWVSTILIGADRAGARVAKEITAHPQCGIRAVGFLDEDPNKVGLVIHGVTVLGQVDKLKDVVKQYGARQALITTTETSGAAIRHIVDLCEHCGIAAKVIPEFADIVGGKINFSRIRDVAIEDILRREPVRLDRDAIASVVRGRKVLITGAGGSIGSELCREVCRFGPDVLLLVEQAENNLFNIHRELTQLHPKVAIIPYVADICDDKRVRQIFAAHRPEVVFHAAAHKHVPLMELNPGEAIKNNVWGTRDLADLAHAYGVAEFVMISTDKAVKPSSVMGVSKRVAELYIQAISQRSNTRFKAVRFGNVLGSAGSVIPIFKEQIARGGPITVTHPEMRRYFMTIPEACQLVLQAASMGRGGEIFILDMGEPVRIVDLARDLIRLSGLTPDKDIEIRYTGIRPGEKLFEELCLEEERAVKTAHPRILIGRLKAYDWEEINAQIEELGELAGSSDVSRMHAKFKEIVTEYCYSNPHGVPETERSPNEFPSGDRGHHVAGSSKAAPFSAPFTVAREPG